MILLAGRLRRYYPAIIVHQESRGRESRIFHPNQFIYIDDVRASKFGNRLGLAPTGRVRYPSPIESLDAVHSSCSMAEWLSFTN